MTKYIVFFVTVFALILVLMNGQRIYFDIQDLIQPKNRFMWGVNTNGYVFHTPQDPFTPSLDQQQLSYWSDLKINSIRFNFEHNGWTPADAVNDTMVADAKKKHLTMLMVIEAPFKDFNNEANYNDGFKWGQLIASRYKGKVPYYQLGNEVDGVSIKKDYPGNKPTDYDEKKYQTMKNYLLGLAAGIKQADPNAKIVLDAHWIGVAIIDRLHDDQVPFDVIGWNWFSDMGDDPTHVKIYDGTILDVPGYLSKYGKPFWITESNRRYGSQDDPTGQKEADYLQTLLTNITKSGEVNGFFVYRLFDTRAETNGKVIPDTQWGLVADQLNALTNQWGPGAKKPAYDVYKNFIKNFKPPKTH